MPALPEDRAAALENIGLVIFDCDGVLIDSEPIASSTLALSLRELGVDITDEQSHEKFTGNAVSSIRGMIETDHPQIDIAALFARWDELLYSGFRQHLSLMPGIADIVSAISRPKCVASNSTMRRLKGSLGLLALWSDFHPHVFSAEAVPHPKPAPDLLLLCAKRLGVDPALCVMIDDSAHGIEAARAAGMTGIGFVDPQDRRPNRADILYAAGALTVAVGAAELPAALELANQALPGSAAALTSTSVQ